jgi:hypothetical protein
METNNLKLVFDHLINILQPIEISRKKETYYDKLYLGLKKRSYTIIFNECNFDNVSNIPAIPGYLIEVNKDNICIMSDDLEYNIAPNQLLTIWNRIKKSF